MLTIVETARVEEGVFDWPYRFERLGTALNIVRFAFLVLCRACSTWLSMPETVHQVAERPSVARSPPAASGRVRAPAAKIWKTVCIKVTLVVERETALKTRAAADASFSFLVHISTYK